MTDINKPQLKWTYGDFGWGMTPMKITGPDDKELWAVMTEIRTMSGLSGFYMTPDVLDQVIASMTECRRDLHAMMDQEDRESRVFDEREARKRVPLDVAERVWATVNVDEDDDVDTIRNSMPLPAEPIVQRIEPGWRTRAAGKPLLMASDEHIMCSCGDAAMPPGFEQFRDGDGIVHRAPPSGPCFVADDARSQGSAEA